MRTPTLLSLLALVWALLVPRLGFSDGGSSPLAELRLAGEALADVEPERPVAPPRELLPAQPVREGSAAVAAVSVVRGEEVTEPARDKGVGRQLRAELKETIRSAIHDEIEREVQQRPSVPGALSARKGVQKSGDSSENGRSEAAQSKSAALSSQQARQNQAVAEAKKENKGQMNKLLLPPSVGMPGKGQALR